MPRAAKKPPVANAITAEHHSEAVATNAPVLIPPSTPIYYADGVGGVSPGAFTSKLIFGLEGGDSAITPSFIVVIPTANLVVFAREILKQLSKDDAVAHVGKVFEAHLENLKTARKL